jgi:hypothetical protein
VANTFIHELLSGMRGGDITASNASEPASAAPPGPGLLGFVASCRELKKLSHII